MNKNLRCLKKLKPLLAVSNKIDERNFRILQQTTSYFIDILRIRPTTPINHDNVKSETAPITNHTRLEMALSNNSKYLMHIPCYSLATERCLMAEYRLIIGQAKVFGSVPISLV